MRSKLEDSTFSISVHINWGTDILKHKTLSWNHYHGQNANDCLCTPNKVEPTYLFLHLPQTSICKVCSFDRIMICEPHGEVDLHGPGITILGIDFPAVGSNVNHL